MDKTNITLEVHLINIERYSRKGEMLHCVQVLNYVKLCA